MLSAFVQLVRNCMCCIKDLQLFRDSWLYDATLLHPYHSFPAPLNETTPLEAMISVAQAFVVVTGVPAALSLFMSSRRKLARLQRLIPVAAASTRRTSTSTDTDRLVNASLVQEAYASLRNMFVAFNLFFISLAFVWLSANSWHITATGWIGGLPALIHALTVMNICLFPLLYFMYKDAGEHFTKATRMRLFVEKLSTGTATEGDVGLTTLTALTDWTPFWKNDTGPWGASDADTETMLAQEKSTVSVWLHDVTGELAASKKTDHDSNEAIQKTRHQRAKAEQLQPHMAVSRLEGYREYVYFVMNAIAWYGYSLCVVVYYWPDELQQPDWLRLVMLHFGNDDADWHGNFAGDLMWATEPIIILSSPWYLDTVRRSRPPSKAKAD